MREIKFRSWNSHSKKMEYIERCHPLFTISFIEYMQYTGLKDKNGKEIYEGDIVKVDSHIGEVKFGHYEYSACEEYGCYRYGYYINCATRGYVDSSGIDIGCYGKCEVVGNVYENPELLEVG